MRLQGARVLLTGATGGIGSELAKALAARGARLGLVGRDAAALARLSETLAPHAVESVEIAADLGTERGCSEAAAAIQQRFGGVDVLLNNAGASEFATFVEQSPQAMECVVQVNVLAPMRLARAVLPGMLARGRGCIVNVGSIFGSIAFAHFTAYSTSKFAVRGFSEALRRELDGSGVDVLYVAPRAVRTALNSPAVMRLAERVGMHMDDARPVAGRIVRALERGERDVYLGFPEALFVRVNALLPRLVDRVLRGQNRIAREVLANEPGKQAEGIGA